MSFSPPTALLISLFEVDLNGSCNGCPLISLRWSTRGAKWIHLTYTKPQVDSMSGIVTIPLDFRSSESHHPRLNVLMVLSIYALEIPFSNVDHLRTLSYQACSRHPPPPPPVVPAHVYYSPSHQHPAPLTPHPTALL